MNVRAGRRLHSEALSIDFLSRGSPDGFPRLPTMVAQGASRAPRPRAGIASKRQRCRKSLFREELFFRSWLTTDSPAMPPVGPLIPQQATFRARLRMSQVDPKEKSAVSEEAENWPLNGCEKSSSRSVPKMSAMAGTSRSNWPESPFPGTCFGKSRGGSMNCDEDPLRSRPRELTAGRKRHERCVWMARKITV